jgi:hypothetical protein
MVRACEPREGNHADTVTSGQRDDEHAQDCTCAESANHHRGRYEYRKPVSFRHDGPSISSLSFGIVMGLLGASHRTEEGGGKVRAGLLQLRRTYGPRVDRGPHHQICQRGAHKLRQQ